MRMVMTYRKLFPVESNTQFISTFPRNIFCLYVFQKNSLKTYLKQQSSIHSLKRLSFRVMNIVTFVLFTYVRLLYCDAEYVLKTYFIEVTSLALM